MKRIVICADGESAGRDRLGLATAAQRPTNVARLACAVRPQSAAGIEQVVVYLARRSGAVDTLTGGAFGRGIDESVRTLYRAIVDRYEPGDELFLFGFSRGAFAIRALAGFMNAVGLVRRHDAHVLPEIHACYERSAAPGADEWPNAFRDPGRVRACPPIKLIGVWDTVGPPDVIGRIARKLNGSQYGHHNVGLHARIENAYQALAIDERRVPFKPNLWQRPQGWTGNLEQAWFPGAHDTLGGCGTEDGLANEALHWMAEKAESHGLELDCAYLASFRPVFCSRLQESMTAKHRIFGVNVRAIGTQPGGAERVHQTAIDRRHLFAGYRPKNLEAYLASAGPGLVYAQTTRIVRGHAVLSASRFRADAERA